MAKKHKWLRNQEYKARLEHEVDNHKTYYSNVYFQTEEPDPRDLREHINQISWLMDRYGCSFEEAIEKYLERERKWGRGRYVYYKRPEVEYTTRYYYKKKGRSKHQKDLKKRTNRRVRQEFKQKGEVYQHNGYRRAQEFWWELD